MYVEIMRVLRICLLLAGPLTEVTAVSGERAVLPCDVKPDIPGDTTIIVLFYHGAVGTPVYRYY